MLKIIKRLFPLSKEGEINRLTSELEAEKAHSADLDNALIELGDLYAAQDDTQNDICTALIELADMIAG